MDNIHYTPLSLCGTDKDIILVRESYNTDSETCL